MSSNAHEILGKIDNFFDKVDKEVDNRLELVGAFVEAKMVAKIESGIPPALSPNTIASKKSSQILIDTGEMLGQVTHRVNGDKSVDIGVIGSAAERAVTHEYGDPSRHIPCRSFERSTYAENKQQIIRILKGT